ncbi:MAG TPA: hypothetical protein VEJ63_10920 [Planctomycetota bacterium]|nr:hypothetical protein [Planctomycetota bacterium]
MKTRTIDNPHAPIGEYIKAAKKKGLLLKSSQKQSYALMPLDDDLIDYLLERSPKLIRECQRIREEMRQGRSLTLDQVEAKYGLRPSVGRKGAARVTSRRHPRK